MEVAREYGSRGPSALCQNLKLMPARTVIEVNRPCGVAVEGFEERLVADPAWVEIYRRR